MKELVAGDLRRQALHTVQPLRNGGAAYTGIHRQGVAGGSKIKTPRDPGVYFLKRYPLFPQIYGHLEKFGAVRRRTLAQKILYGLNFFGGRVIGLVGYDHFAAQSVNRVVSRYYFQILQRTG